MTKHCGYVDYFINTTRTYRRKFNTVKQLNYFLSQCRPLKNNLVIYIYEKFNFPSFARFIYAKTESEAKERLSWFLSGCDWLPDIQTFDVACAAPNTFARINNNPPVTVNEIIKMSDEMTEDEYLKYVQENCYCHVSARPPCAVCENSAGIIITEDSTVEDCAYCTKHGKCLFCLGQLPRP